MRNEVGEVHDEDVPVAVTPALECDAAAVGRPVGVAVVGVVGRDAHGEAARAGDGPNVAAPVEGQRGAVGAERRVPRVDGFFGQCSLR